jgi:predicted esterase
VACLLFASGLLVLLRTSRLFAELSQPVASNVGNEAHWCAPELVRVNDRACYFAPTLEGHDELKRSENHTRGTLVIFLHSLIGAEPMAAWEQQRRMMRMARTYGFEMLVPRGRPGLGPGRKESVLAWPTAQDTQALAEEQLLMEWRTAIEWVTARRGAFERTLLFGFSNGAYYATSLTFRERFPVSGAAVFAGGSGSKYQRLHAARAKHKIPLFVSFGTLDPDHPQQQQLVHLLRTLRWPHASLKADVGHTVAGAQLSAALRYLGHPVPHDR